MFRKICALRVTGTRSYISGYGAYKYYGMLKFYLKRVFKQILCGQKGEDINHHATKIIIQVMHLLAEKS